MFLICDYEFLFMSRTETETGRGSEAGFQSGEHFQSTERSGWLLRRDKAERGDKKDLGRGGGKINSSKFSPFFSFILKIRVFIVKVL